MVVESVGWWTVLPLFYKSCSWSHVKHAMSWAHRTDHAVHESRIDAQLALLDMIFSFADLVTISPLPFTRPELAADGPLSIRGGRHPIVGAVQENCKFVPNDTYMR